MTKKNIRALSVCHNTPKYMELMIRSLYMKNTFDDIDFNLSVLDNNSSEDTSNIKKLSESLGFYFGQSGYKTTQSFCSHGIIINEFISTHKDCDYYLLLDTDLIFVSDETINVMVETLDKHHDAFGSGPYFTWDGVNKIPMADEYYELTDLYNPRLHPCCALLRNDKLLHDIVKHIGFGCYKNLNLSGEYIDTAEMLTRVMWTHGRYHVRADTLIHHFFMVSYGEHPKYIDEDRKNMLNWSLKKVIFESDRKLFNVNTKKRLRAVSVCHNTPKFMEVMIRSLYHKNSFDSIEFQLTVYDNNSTKDTSNISALSKLYGFEFKQSGYSLDFGINSHGMIIDSFVKDNPDCDYILTLDTDIVFIEDSTIVKMVEVLEKDPGAYGTGPFYSWDGVSKMPLPEEFPGLNEVYLSRLHPCCALFRNDEIFQNIVGRIGFEEYKRLNISEDLFERARKRNNIQMYDNPDMYRIEYLDTAQMIKKVMETHKRYHLRTDALILHFFSVSYYNHEENVKEYHERKLNEFLKLYTEGSEQV